jgi:hypothetical protein
MIEIKSAFEKLNTRLFKKSVWLISIKNLVTIEFQQFVYLLLIKLTPTKKPHISVRLCGSTRVRTADPLLVRQML